MPFAGGTRVFLSDRPDHLDLSRDHIQLLAGLLADALEIVAFRTMLLVLRKIDDDFLPKSIGVKS